MTSEQVKGYMFEEIIASLLRRSGYYWEEISDEADELQGRGSKHQIDVFGLAGYSHPFVSKIRLLGECKYRVEHTVGIEVVRNMVGVLQDISQNYFSKDHEIAKQILFDRYTDTGVIFSNTAFSRDAVSYGFAHNVFLVSYQGNPLMNLIVNAFENICKFIDLEKVTSKKQARDFIKGTLNGHIQGDILNLYGYLYTHHDYSHIKMSADTLIELLVKTTSAIAFIEGSYPIHILAESETSLPIFDQLMNSPRYDNGTIKVGYKYIWTDGDETVRFLFKINPDSNIYYFTLPSYIFSNERLRSRNLIPEKEQFLKHIAIPFLQVSKINEIVLEFDREIIDTDWQ